MQELEPRCQLSREAVAQAKEAEKTVKRCEKALKEAEESASDAQARVNALQQEIADIGGVKLKTQRYKVESLSTEV